MRTIAVAIVLAWVGLHGPPASAQSFDERWSVIPKAHAEQPPPAGPQQTQRDPSSQPEPSPPSAANEGIAHRSDSAAKQTFYGKASFYSYPKGTTASGSVFDRNLPTAAHRSLPFGTTLRVTNLINNKSVVVTVTDRGPHSRGRVLDLSLDAARRLEIGDRGVVDVRAEVL